jgi:Icc-related predicted phosphoesterase
MKKIIWLSDLHLNFLSNDGLYDFLKTVVSHEPDLVMITGDISDSTKLIFHLKILETEIKKPIYFVLGNHDFYHNSIKNIRKEVSSLVSNFKNLSWLTELDIIEITSSTAIVGHDAWADGRFGNFFLSPFLLNDYFLIQELMKLGAKDLLKMIQKLGDEGANHFRKFLPIACQAYQRIFLLTHAPPFQEACWHKGQLSDDKSLPHFSCKAVGDVLIEIMQMHQDCHLTVLCGHTHSAGVVKVLSNLLVYTGNAQYGKPEIQKIFE